MKIVITGPKGSGKSSIGRLLHERLDIPFVETDGELERLYAEKTGHRLTFREIYRELGEEGFRALEERAVECAAAREWCLVCTGGSTMLNPRSRRLLRRNAVLVFVHASPEVLWQRLQRGGLPPYLEGPDAKERFFTQIQTRLEVLAPFADVLVDTSAISTRKAADEVLLGIEEELAVRAGDPNTLGEVIRLTTFGESHGPALGAILDGVPPGVSLCEEDIQEQLDRRRPGQSALTTSRQEADRVRILSGVFEGKTTGAPIGLLVENMDQDSSKYEALREVFRPGHADFTFWHKYGLRDHRGGGRSSGRETAMRVAGGAVARKILAERGVRLVAYALEIGGIRAAQVDYDEIERNPARCPDARAAEAMAQAVMEARSRGDSVGGIVQLEVTGLPAGLGDPVFGKLDALLGRAVLSLGAVKGVEFGAGFAAAKMTGSRFNDAMCEGTFTSNNAGGVLGGISTGQDLVVRAAIKPTPSVSLPQQTSDTAGDNTTIAIEGRHDPCIVPRVIPVIESMAALVILDLWEIQNRLRPNAEHSDDLS